MAVLEPTIKFFKLAVGLAAGVSAATDYTTLLGTPAWNISYPPGGPQSGNWVGQVDAGAGGVPGEEDHWAIPPFLAAPLGPVDSGVGFYSDTSPTKREIIQKNLSSLVNIGIFNNLEVVPAGAVPPSVASAENCELKTYDEPYGSPPTQASEPITNVVGTQHRFWLSAAQIAYHVYDSGGGTWDPQLNKVLPGPYCLGEAPGRVPGGLVPNDPLDPPANPPLPDADNVWRLISVPPPQGVGAFPIGSRTYSRIGCDDVAANPATSCSGGAAEIQLQIAVPFDATARTHIWALALEYTYAVE